MKNPVLGLLFRVLLPTLGVYFLREYSSSFFALLFFLFSFWFVYLKPPLNNRKFLVSSLGLVALPILLPLGGRGLEWLFLILWALALFLLLGVNTLVLLRWQSSYEAVHLILIFGFSLLYLLGLLPLVSQIILFLVFFLLFREFYLVSAPSYPQRLTLAASLMAFVLVEVAWILSFSSINFLAGAAFLALTVYLFHDLILHHFQGTLSRQIILRNVTLFVALSLILLLA